MRVVVFVGQRAPTSKQVGHMVRRMSWGYVVLMASHKP